MDELYKQSQQAQAINQMYDAQKESQLNQLQATYDQQRSDYEAAAAKIPQQYQTQANDLASQYERQRRNFNQQAAASGLNTGAASQAQLGQNSAYQRAYAGLRTAQADAMTEADRQMLNLENTYKTQVSAALANNDYERARSLLNEYNNYYNRSLQQAQTLASYGDFSGYANIYGADAAANMSSMWNAQNPYLAYATGRISEGELNKLLAAYGSGGGSSSGGRSRSGGGGGGGGNGGGGGGNGGGGGGNGGGGGGDGNGDPNADYYAMLAERAKYASDSDFYAAMMNRTANDTWSKAGQLAQQYGYQPGTTEYNRFIKTAYSDLIKDTDYDTYKGAYDDEQSKKSAAADKKAKEEARIARGEAAAEHLTNRWESRGGVG